MNEPASTGEKRRPSGLSRAIRGIDRTIEFLEMFIVAGSILLMAGLMVTHVLGRTFLRIGVPGTTEVTEILIILITFVGVSYAVRRARHISMSAFYDNLSGVARKALLIVICIVTGAMLLFLAWEAMGYVQSIHGRGRATSALDIPLWLVYLAVPIGLVLAGIQYWLTALRNLTTREMYRSFTELERYDEVPGVSTVTETPEDTTDGFQAAATDHAPADHHGSAADEPPRGDDSNVPPRRDDH